MNEIVIYIIVFLVISAISYFTKPKKKPQKQVEEDSESKYSLSEFEKILQNTYGATKGFKSKNEEIIEQYVEKDKEEKKVNEDEKEQTKVDEYHSEDSYSQKKEFDLKQAIIYQTILERKDFN